MGKRAEQFIPSPVKERIPRLEESGILAGYRLELDPRELGYHVTAFVRIRPIPGHLNKIAELAQPIPEITECHRITGEDCFIPQSFLERNRKFGSRIRQVSGSRTNHNIYRAIVACPPEKSPASAWCLGATMTLPNARRTGRPKYSAQVYPTIEVQLAKAASVLPPC